MCVVANVDSDAKGLLKSVNLRNQKGKLYRPVNKLVLLLAAEDRMGDGDDSHEHAHKFRPCLKDRTLTTLIILKLIPIKFRCNEY